MGIVLARAELVWGLEPLAGFDTESVRQMWCEVKGDQAMIVCDEDHKPAAVELDVWVECDGERQYVGDVEEEFSTPALWERAWCELLSPHGIATPEKLSKAFVVLDPDGRSFIDSRETIGALAVLSHGHLIDRMRLVFEIFDLNHRGSMSPNECFLMLRRLAAGLRKMVNIVAPPEKVVNAMVKQIWRNASKSMLQPAARISVDNWHNWWMKDTAIRGVLKMFVKKKDHAKGLPEQHDWIDIDYMAQTEMIDQPDIMQTVKGHSAMLGQGKRLGSKAVDHGKRLGSKCVAVGRMSSGVQQLQPHAHTFAPLTNGMERSTF